MKYSFIKSSKFKIFSSGLMLTTLTSPLLFTSIAPIQQKQIAPEIKIQSNEFSSTEILKNNIIEYVFENDKKNIDSIKFELNKLVKSNKLDDLSEEDLNKFTENVISFTKDHFKDKEVLEEAWYHVFPMVFWSGLYAVATISDLRLALLGEIFNNLPTFIDIGQIVWNTLSGDYVSATVNAFILTTRLLSSMYTDEKDIIRKSIGETQIGLINDLVLNPDLDKMMNNVLKNFSISFSINTYANIYSDHINPLIQKAISVFRGIISYSKVKIWANYLYYYNLYWG